MKSEFDSYEDLEAKVRMLEAENETLKQQAYNAKGYLYSDCLEQAEEKIKELTAQIAVLREALERIAKFTNANFASGASAIAKKALSTTNEKTEIMDSYEDLEAKVWWLEGINQKLIAENEALKEEVESLHNDGRTIYAMMTDKRVEQLKSEIEVYMQNIQFHFENNSALAAENASLRESLENSSKDLGDYAKKWWERHCHTNKHMETTKEAHQDFCSAQFLLRKALSTTNEKTEIMDSYEDLEAKVWKLEHENDKLREENEKLKELAYTPKGFEWKDCCEQAEAEIKELTAQVAALEGDVERLNQKHLEVNHKLLRRALHTEAQVAVLREALEKAKDGVENWGTYADKYFQDKWNLQGDIAAIDKALTNTNKQAEKMMKVVEAVGNWMVDAEESSHDLYRAYAEYQALKEEQNETKLRP